MRRLGAIALSSRASLQPPFAALPVTRLRLSQDSAPQTADPFFGCACDTEVPAQSMRAQGVHWHALPPPRPYIYLRPLSPTSLRHRRRNRTAQQPFLDRACDTEVVRVEASSSFCWLQAKSYRDLSVSAVQWLGVMPRLVSNKSLKPRNTLYTLPSEPQPDSKHIIPTSD